MKKTPNIIFSDYSLEGIINTLSRPEIKKVLFESVFEKIRNSINTSKKEIIVCDIIQLEVSIHIPKKEWNNVLQTILNYYINIEDYSMCSNISKVIKDIKNG